MESMNPSTISSNPRQNDTTKSSERRHVSFSGRLNDSPNSSSTVPLLLNPSYSRSKSLAHDELRYFRTSLKWCTLDHSSCARKAISYFVFIFLTIFVPIVGSFSVHVPPTSLADDPVSLNKLVQIPESALSAIAFFTLTRFFGQFGLRQLLFLDRLQDDSQYVRREYSRELDKAFKSLAYIFFPSFFIELAHKILFFSTVKVSVPYLTYGGVPCNSIVFIAVLASWVYRTGVFLLLCVFFRLTCELQILRFEGFQKMFQAECGSDAGVMFIEHMRIRKQLWVTSHMYRFFIITCLLTITVSQFGALFLVLASKSQKSFFNSGDLVVCSAVQLSGFFLCLMGAARITHRAQGIASIATKWHMQVTTGVYDTTTNTKDQMTDSAVSQDSDCTIIKIPSQEASPYHTRLALVTYLQHNNGGITLFGFPLDRGLLHTLFAFEFSLVLWILSKVVVLS
ncbi:hypothetical protein ACHQM5_030612 [Ranunculus cassubicifolius]